ncbi:adenylate kinase family enzyme [Microbacterium sp. SORGH_AS 888]|nr:adenylate kinase family enzyme [Microbacterium sp. SORGH_AS_0888]
MTARLLIVGPQGSGKGTQGVRIAEAFGVPAISTGDVFRAAIKDGTALGTQVQAIIEAGNLVPDELTSAVVRERLSEDDAAAGFLLDGYPRNLGQVGDLDAFLEARDESLDAVIELSVPREESIDLRRGTRACASPASPSAPRSRDARTTRKRSSPTACRSTSPRRLPSWASTATGDSCSRSTASARSTRSPSAS